MSSTWSVTPGVGPLSKVSVTRLPRGTALIDLSYSDAEALGPPLRGRVRQLATLALSCRHIGAN
jgi:hypothetical protein